jgi:hypothetical protein
VKRNGEIVDFSIGLQRYLGNPTHPNSAGSRRAQIDNASPDKRPSVINAHHHRAPSVIRNSRAKWEAGMRSS